MAAVQSSVLLLLSMLSHQWLRTGAIAYEGDGGYV